MNIDLNKIKELLKEQFEHLKNSSYSEEDLKEIIFGEDDVIETYLREEFDIEPDSAAMLDIIDDQCLRDLQHDLIDKLLTHY